MDDSLTVVQTFSPNEWNTVDENYTTISDSKVKTPEEFAKEVEELKAKYKLQTPDLWETPKDSHSVKH